MLNKWQADNASKHESFLLKNNLKVLLLSLTMISASACSPFHLKGYAKDKASSQSPARRSNTSLMLTDQSNHAAFIHLLKQTMQRGSFKLVTHDQPDSIRLQIQTVKEEKTASLIGLDRQALQYNLTASASGILSNAANRQVPIFIKRSEFMDVHKDELNANDAEEQLIRGHLLQQLAQEMLDSSRRLIPQLKITD